MRAHGLAILLVEDALGLINGGDLGDLTLLAVKSIGLTELLLGVPLLG